MRSAHSNKNHYILGGPQETTCIEFQKLTISHTRPNITKIGANTTPKRLIIRPIKTIKNLYITDKKSNKNIYKKIIKLGFLTALLIGKNIAEVEHCCSASLLASDIVERMDDSHYI